MVMMANPQFAEDAERLRCPSCECPHVPVCYTRPRGNRIRRVRECRHCGRRFSTIEKPETG